MDNFILSPDIIDGIGKLSVEVVSILVLAMIVKWISASNNALATSHKTLSESHKKIAESHEKLIENNQKLFENNKQLTDVVQQVANAVKQDVKLTRGLISTMDKTKCKLIEARNVKQSNS